MSREFFYGRTDGRMADKKRRKNFILGSPLTHLLTAPRTGDQKTVEDLYQKPLKNSSFICLVLVSWGHKSSLSSMSGPGGPEF